MARGNASVKLCLARAATTSRNGSERRHEQYCRASDIPCVLRKGQDPQLLFLRVRHFHSSDLAFRITHYAVAAGAIHAGMMAPQGA